jgi:hypothetical protein
MKTIVIELDPFFELLAQEIYANYQAEFRKLASNAVEQFPARGHRGPPVRKLQKSA